MLFLNRNSDKAVYVLISFYRNFTARRLDSSITYRPLWTYLKTPDKSKSDNDEKNESCAARRGITPLATV
jgi:hypothetical protein